MTDPAITPDAELPEEQQDEQDEHVAAAQAAGLRYVTDADRGITRKGSGKGFAYYDPTGQLIRDRAIRRRIKTLVIPPAWTDVWICPDPDGHIQVTGRDARGRKQYRYHPKFRAVRDQTKFGRILEFSRALPQLREQVERDLARRGLPREKVLAATVRLLDRTLIRVGNPEYARHNKSFGLTTLKRRHVAVSGSKLEFTFRGKSGIQHTVSITDRRLARIVQRCRELPGEELFQYIDDEGSRETVTSADINDYLREVSGLEVTAKDFRTWAGTMLAATALSELGTATSEREAKKRVVQAIDRVAERLGNTRSVCRSYYVHPAVIDAYMDGRVVEVPPEAPEGPDRRSRPTAALRHDEIAVLQFLQTELQPDGQPVPGDPS